MDLSVFSPPFAELYVYSDSPRDLGNCKSYEEFFEHFSFLTPELYRVMKPGRIVAVHCMDIPTHKGKEGFIGIRDFSGMLVQNLLEHGFIYHSRITIWKDPVTAMQRTKALGLLHKQVKKDSTMSRVGIPDYILIFRKDGVNEVPVANKDLPVELWQKIASPVWGEGEIDFGDTLQYRAAKDNNDEKHICALQLPIIERIVKLYSNENEVVFSPFAGIASEGYQSLIMKRRFVGFELKPSYYKQGVKNLRHAEELLKQQSLL